eukprot:CAMPEP_0184430690 /NCGR_PEP_ID=MMETSP0738-20130409/284581_1 /TAXON_ID=385413 /ORGANISM="Thalassiosira miniscula, Strain CCMP1093" /LENGTH=86 /DNA_ID=CAMNT_0026795353 /DNA_START=13 /DNA_END=270 /DNA_ORIENTATION=+
MTSAPDTGHFSCFTSAASSLEEPRDDVGSSKKLTEEERDMTVGVALPDVWFLRFPLSSDSMSAARTSGAKDSHISAMDFGTVGEAF